ncbi:hypothetical protein GvMRE_IIg398 [endosymbiont GvMRE of Glomus versiforme]|nr:hypothetical protein GvMRE_IIg398 [endosymbiont GvMRE of Glomus versiforme]
MFQHLVAKNCHDNLFILEIFVGKIDCVKINSPKTSPEIQKDQ